MGRMRVSFFVSSWIIIHLGIKPVSGGSPPMESRVSIVKIVMVGIVFHIWASSSVVVVEFWMSNMNMVKVITM